MKNKEKFLLLEQQYPEIGFTRVAQHLNPLHWVVVKSDDLYGSGFIWSTKHRQRITVGLELIAELEDVINFRTGLDILMI